MSLDQRELVRQIDARQTKLARIHVSSSMSKGSAAWDQSYAGESGRVTTLHGYTAHHVIANRADAAVAVQLMVQSQNGDSIVYRKNSSS